MNSKTKRRIDALEDRYGDALAPLLVLVRLVRAGRRDEDPVGILAAPPYLPAMDCGQGESWEDFVARIHGMLATLTPGTVVAAICRPAAADGASDATVREFGLKGCAPQN